MMTDRSPALREAMTQNLYKDHIFNPTRLRVLVYSSQGVINESEAFVDFDTPSHNWKVTKNAIEFMFSDEGLLIRNILIEKKTPRV